MSRTHTPSASNGERSATRRAPSAYRNPCVPRSMALCWTYWSGRPGQHRRNQTSDRAPGTAQRQCHATNKDAQASRAKTAGGLPPAQLLPAQLAAAQSPSCLRLQELLSHLQARACLRSLVPRSLGLGARLGLGIALARLCSLLCRRRLRAAAALGCAPPRTQ